VIRRGYIYAVSRVLRDTRATRPVLVMTSDARNFDPRSPTVVAVPLTTSLKGGIFRVAFRRGVGGLPLASEAACEQIVQVPKQNFLADRRGVVRPLGGRVDDDLLDAVVRSVVAVISA
jgi:mRNA-degrading endonuclease toxin of MazEF toxin-antitoxin module